jgi:hypothetical protein
MQRMLKVLLISIFIIGNLCDSCGETMNASSIEDCKGLALSSDEENLTTDTCCYYTINLSGNSTGFCYGSIKGQESSIKSQIEEYFNEQGSNVVVNINCNSSFIQFSSFVLILGLLILL